MNVVIFGATAVGQSLAKWLLSEWHEVSIIDNDNARIQETESNLGSIIVEGDGTHQNILEDAGTSRAEIFIASSESEADNMVACQMAKHLFNVKHTTCMTYSDENKTLFELLGIDSVINVTKTALRAVQETLNVDVILRLMEVPGPTPANLVCINVAQGSEVVGEKISDLQIPDGVSIKMIVRSGAIIEDSIGNATIRAEDQILAIADVINLDQLKELFQ